MFTPLLSPFLPHPHKGKGTAKPQLRNSLQNQSITTSRAAKVDTTVYQDLDRIREGFVISGIGVSLLGWSYGVGLIDAKRPSCAFCGSVWG